MAGRPLRALLVDLDGTLVDSHPALRATFDRFLAAHGVVATDEEYQRWNGPPLKEIVAGLRAEHSITADVGALLDEYQRLLETSYVTSAPLMPGADALLSWAESEGIACAVVTSSPARLAHPLLARLGVLSRVEATICGDEVARGKPSGDPYVEALRRLDVAAGEALAIEDTATGVLAARAAGIRCVAIGAAGQEAPLAHSGALVVVESLVEAAAVVDGYRRQGGRVMSARTLEARVVRELPPLPAELAANVNVAWDSALARRPHLSDGEILVVDRIVAERDALIVEVARTRYRRFIAQRSGLALGLRPLGVSGVTIVHGPTGESGIVLGRRTSSVTQYPGCWELVPSGGLPASRAALDGAVDAPGQLLEELAEEVGVKPRAALVPLGLVEDLDEGVLDLCFLVETDEAPTLNDEYDEIRLLPLADPRRALAAIALAPGQLVATVEPLLGLLADYWRASDRSPPSSSE